MKKGQEKKLYRKKGSSSGRVTRDENPIRLPVLVDQLSVPMTLRFVTSTVFTGQFTVTPANLLDAWFTAGTATTAYQLFDYVRVKKVTIRAMGRDVQSGGSILCPTATVGIEFYGLIPGTFPGGRMKTETALGFTEPAMCSLVPDPKSQAAQFQPSSTAQLFAIRAVDQAFTPIAGAVIDVEVMYRNSADVSPAAVAVARAGLTPGNLYFGGLDGQPTATTAAPSVFVPRA